ncbi:MAG: GNAT family N-acetyltransferase [Candidatus Bathyarchaeia archaeon]
MEDVDSLIYLCIPSEKRNDRVFIEGADVKRAWARKSLEVFGGVAKMAYLDSKPVGLIQYQPKPKKRLLEITCIFVPDRRNQRRGVGKTLLNALIVDVKKPREFFDYKPPRALVTWAFQVPGYYPQNEFYLKMGFKKVKDDDPFLLYYPLEEGYVYQPEEAVFIPQVEDKGKALIFYDPSCPFCMYFGEHIKNSIREVAPDLPVRMVNMFEEAEEVEKRGQVPQCAVNGKAIKASFMDRVNFQKEVREALEV